MFDINGKVAVVTGAASGIGLATVKMILAKGGKVVASDYNKEGLEKEMTSLEKDYEGKIGYIACDVSKEEQVKAMVDYTLEKFGRVDIAVANAGISGLCPLLDQSEEQWRHVLGINLDGVYYTDKYTIEQMVKQGEGGAVVNISSIAGITGLHMASAYGASKGAVRTMSKALACEFKPKGIRVNSVHPGNTLSGMVNKDIFGDDLINQLKAGGILGTAEDLAHAIIFCIENEFFTAQELVVDGGQLTTYAPDI